LNGLRFVTPAKVTEGNAEPGDQDVNPSQHCCHR